MTGTTPKVINKEDRLRQNTSKLENEKNVKFVTNSDEVMDVDDSVCGLTII